MKKVIRIIFRAIICIFLLITFLFLLKVAFPGLSYQPIPWINFLLKLPTKDLIISIYMGWILVSLIAWAFSNWFE